MASKRTEKTSAESQPRPAGHPSNNELRRRVVETFRALLELHASRKTMEACQLNHNDVKEAIGVGNYSAVQEAMKFLADFCHAIELGREAKSLRIRTDFFHGRFFDNRALKEEVAMQFAAQIPAGSSLVCSAGSTVAIGIRTLIQDERKYVRIVTTNVGILELGGGFAASIRLTGGEYNPDLHAFTGPEVFAAFDKGERPRYAVMGISGITEDGKLFVQHPDEPAIRVAMMKASPALERVIILCDKTKFGSDDYYHFADLKELVREKPVTLITNARQGNEKSDDSFDAVKRQLRKNIDSADFLLLDKNPRYKSKQEPTTVEDRGDISHR